MKASSPQLPARGTVVTVEKVADQMYRLVDHGRPLEMGLFTTPDAAGEACKQRGWRPETASIPTMAKRVVKKNLPASRQSNLDF